MSSALETVDDLSEVLKKLETHSWDDAKRDYQSIRDIGNTGKKYDAGKVVNAIWYYKIIDKLKRHQQKIPSEWLGLLACGIRVHFANFQQTRNHGISTQMGYDELGMMLSD